MILCNHFVSLMQSVEVGQHFTLDSLATGVNVVTNTSLDFELIRSYLITVSASDNGNPVQSRYYNSAHCCSLTQCTSCFPCSITTVMVDVVDVNDHAPEFIFTGNDSYSLEIPENSPFMRFENFFLASDEDSTSNGMIEFVPSNITSK